MKRSILFIVLVFVVTGQIISCQRTSPHNTDTTEMPVSETETTRGSIVEKILPSVAELVEIPDSPMIHPPLEPADYGTQFSEGLEYKLTGNYYTVVGMGTCTDIKLVIPAEYKGKPVKAIAPSAFGNRVTGIGIDTITSVVISEGIEIIGDDAFICCGKIRNVQLPTTLKTLGEAAFYGCVSLVEVSIPEGIQNIQAGTFMHCTSLQKVFLPISIKSIGADAFNGCENIHEINLPEGLEVIENNAFAGCISLKNIYLPSTLKSVRYSSLRAGKDIMWTDRFGHDIPNGYADGDIRTEGWIHNLYYQGTMEQYLERVACGQFEMIYRYAVNFYIDGDLVDFITIQEGTKIPNNAFRYCQSIKGIIMPPKCFDNEDKLYEYIGEGAFSDCPNLEYIVIQGELPKDSLFGENGYWLHHVAGITLKNSFTMKRSRAEINTVATKRLFVSYTESEAVHFMQNCQYIYNEGPDSDKYPELEVYYAGEWAMDSNGLPVIES